MKVLGWMVVAGIVIYFLYNTFAPDKTKLANQYNIPESQILIDPKPHGCDFDDAPLGNKHCHYEKNVQTTKACPAPDCKVTAMHVSWLTVEE